MPAKTYPLNRRFKPYRFTRHLFPLPSEIMIDFILFWTFWSLIITATCQIGFTLTFTRLLKPVPTKTLPTPALKATVVLCLRGADPFLSHCLHGLLHQDYPNYTVHIVIDSPTDPAWDIVTQKLSATPDPRVRVSVLNDRKGTCSLKCSALLQAIADLDDDCEIVAFIDGDVIPYASWLRELVIPLQNKEVAATTGNRWYRPNGKQWGALIRYVWNASAVVTMYFNNIPWGGSLAFKTRYLHQTHLLELWEQALCEDVPSYQAIKAHQLKIQFVPSVLMVNREECTIESFLQWVTRQFLLVRLYHPSWWGALFYSVNTLSLILIASGAVVLGLGTGYWAIAGWMGLALLTFFGIAASLVWWLERSIQRVLRARGETVQPFPLATMLKLLICLPISQFICTKALVSTLWMRSVQWRGVSYSVKAPWQICLLQDAPYLSLESVTHQKISL